jgi:hypothetical protein
MLTPEDLAQISAAVREEIAAAEPRTRTIVREEIAREIGTVRQEFAASEARILSHVLAESPGAPKRSPID